MSCCTMALSTPISCLSYLQERSFLMHMILSQSIFLIRLSGMVRGNLSCAFCDLTSPLFDCTHLYILFESRTYTVQSRTAAALDPG
jgi:hypothetical protein